MALYVQEKELNVAESVYCLPWQGFIQGPWAFSSAASADSPQRIFKLINVC